MRDTSVLSDLYDLTIGYEEMIGQDDDFTLGRIILQGPVQRNYHIHMEKYDALEISEFCEDELKEWLYDIYDEKEKRLEFFETNQPPSLDFEHTNDVQDASFTNFEYFAGISLR